MKVACARCKGSGRELTGDRGWEGCWLCCGAGFTDVRLGEKDVFAILGEVGAVITNNHIVYSSWKHGSAYVNKDAVYPYTRKIRRLCVELAECFENENVQVVIAPAVGGVILSQWVAHHLSDLSDTQVLGVYADKVGDEFVIKRGYDRLVTGKNILVVEDVLTTGGSAKKVVEAVRAIGGNVIGLGALCNRGGITTQDVADVPKLFALVNVTLDAWDETDCLLCKQGVPINTDVGKGREFLARTKSS